jgi:secreted trypsin-like serine protease
MRSSLLAVSLLSIASIASVACSVATPEGPVDEDIIGGVEATSATLDAVGSLMLEQPGQAKAAFCTGALISPTMVLTAKHCAWMDAASSGDGAEHLFTELGTVSFAIGSNSAAPKREVKAKSVTLAGLKTGGSLNMGSDVAVYELSEAVNDVAALPVAKNRPAAGDVGKKFVAIGYGVRDRAQNAGTRMMGNITLSALSGKPYELAFGTFEAYRENIIAALGRAPTPEEETQIQTMYNTPLMPDYEAFFGAKDGDVQACSGDSGGPLLRKVGGKLQIFGVASWVPSKSERSPCSRGVVYATFGASARELIDDSLGTACGDVPVAGRCEGTVAVRCISLDEGSPRVTKTQCADVDQVCKVVDGKAACVDP